MILRVADRLVRQLASQYPVVLVKGPRQSGKTTLTRTQFPAKPYANLEALNTRASAEADPVGFLNSFPEGAVLDEVQRVPKLLSEIQVRVDQKATPGLFILTGSHQAELHAATAQSLAGRVAILKLLPLSFEEISSFPASADEMMFRGFYPRVVTQNLDPTQVYGSYVETYLEKDLRQLTQIRDLGVFQKFLRLCAGRIGQLINIDQLANDTGVSSTTVRNWLSVLEASFVITLVKPYFKNISKRLIKAPKIYFHDVGVACFLLGIESPRQLHTHPLRSNLFENLVIIDFIKARWNRGLREQLTFFRDQSGNEVDAILEVGGEFLPVEIKSGETLDTETPKGFLVFAGLESKRPLGNLLIYAGAEAIVRKDGRILPFLKLPEFYTEATEFFRPLPF